MSKVKEHYYQELEAMAEAESADNECYCAPDIRGLDDLCSPCGQEIPDEVFNRLASELDDTMSEREFWSKMNEIEEFYEEHYMSPHVTEADDVEEYEPLAEAA